MLYVLFQTEVSSGYDGMYSDLCSNSEECSHFFNLFSSISLDNLLQEKQSPYLVEISLKFPPSSRRTLAKRTAFTNGTAANSSKHNPTWNLYFFFFIMNAMFQSSAYVTDMYQSQDIFHLIKVPILAQKFLLKCSYTCKYS